MARFMSLLAMIGMLVSILINSQILALGSITMALVSISHAIENKK